MVLFDLMDTLRDEHVACKRRRQGEKGGRKRNILTASLRYWGWNLGIYGVGRVCVYVDGNIVFAV